MDNLNQMELLNNLDENSSLRDIQNYIKKVIDIRGFGKQSIQDGMLMFLEEAGELAKAIRKSASNIAIDKSKIQNYDTIESEVADVFIVLTAICNTLNIDIFSALKDKENINIKRKWEA